MARQDSVFDRLSHGAPLAVFLALGLFLAYELLGVLELIAIAMLVALVLRSIVEGLERLKVPGWLAAVILVGILVGLGALIKLVVIPRLVEEAQTLSSDKPGSFNALTDLLRSVPFIPEPAQLLQRLKGFLVQWLGYLPTLVASTAAVFAAILAGLFLTLYMAINPDPLILGVLRLIPSDRRDGFREFVKRLGKRLRGWIVGTAVVASFVGAAAGVGLWLLGVPLPLTFGIIAGVLNIIPFFGSVVGALLPALLALTISPLKAVEVVALFVAINQIEAHILQPQIMGREINLHPAMVIVSFLVFGTLLGIVGVFLAVPAAVLVGVITDELTEKTPSLGGEPSLAEEEEAEKKEE